MKAKVTIRIKMTIAIKLQIEIKTRMHDKCKHTDKDEHNDDDKDISKYTNHNTQVSNTYTSIHKLARATPLAVVARASRGGPWPSW